MTSHIISINAVHMQLWRNDTSKNNMHALQKRRKLKKKSKQKKRNISIIFFFQSCSRISAEVRAYKLYAHTVDDIRLRLRLSHFKRRFWDQEVTLKQSIDDNQNQISISFIFHLWCNDLSNGYISLKITNTYF